MPCLPDQIETWLIGRRTLLVEGLIAGLERSRFRVEHHDQLDHRTLTDSGRPLLCLLIDEENGSPGRACEVTATLRGMCPDTRIVIVAASPRFDPVEYLEAGANAALTLGYSAREVTFLLEQIVSPDQRLFISPRSRNGATEARPLSVPPPSLELVSGREMQVACATRLNALPPNPAHRMLIHFSRREREVLRGLFDGESNKMLARQLAISEATVKAHVRTLFRKLGANNRTQAIRRVMDYCPNETSISDWLTPLPPTAQARSALAN